MPLELAAAYGFSLIGAFVGGTMIGNKDQTWIGVGLGSLAVSIGGILHHLTV